jgi:hypothetical protein
LSYGYINPISKTRHNRFSSVFIPKNGALQPRCPPRRAFSREIFTSSRRSPAFGSFVALVGSFAWDVARNNGGLGMEKVKELRRGLDLFGNVLNGFRV